MIPHIPLWVEKSRRRAEPCRIHVGYRRATFEDVWYRPIIVEGMDPDAEGFVPEAAYTIKAHGAPGPGEPMDGEILFHPHFAPPNDESSKSKERERKQMILLFNLHRYLDEEDLDRVTQLEQDLDYSVHRRWHTVFEAAKKYKQTKLMSRQKRRAYREAQARKVAEQDPTIDPKDIEVTSDTSDESGYESGERHIPLRTKGSSSMAPPLSKRPSNNKRNGTPQGSDRAPKRPRPGQTPRPSRSDREGTAESGLFMSGVRSTLSPFGRRSRARSSSVVNGDFEDDGDLSDDNTSVSTDYRFADIRRGTRAARDAEMARCNPPAAGAGIMNRNLGDGSEDGDQRPENSTRLGDDDAMRENGGMTEEEATAAATRLSLAPETRQGNSAPGAPENDENGENGRNGSADPNGDDGDKTDPKREDDEA